MKTAGTAGSMALAGAAALVALATLAGMAAAQPKAAIEKLTGVWVEGRGFDVTYGGTYESCAQRCLGEQRCVMLEFYRPEKKCNLYDSLRPRKAGGSSFVGIRS